MILKERDRETILLFVYAVRVDIDFIVFFFGGM